MEKKYGVYICKGCSIADTVDTEKLAEVATKEHQIPVCKSHDALCSPSGLDLIKGDISGEGVNTVIVAACSPRAKHREFIFPGCIVERANIREFVAWTQEPGTEDTQALAEDYMRLGITKAKNSFPPEPFLLEETNKDVLVIGGGITGMTSALGAADAGYKVILVEKSGELGGWAAKMHKQLPQSYPFEALEENTVKRTIDKVSSHSNIKVYTSAEIEKIAGFPGQYDVSIKTNGTSEQAKAGSVILAAGWRPYDANKLDHLGYGKNPNVITNVQMEEIASSGRITRPSDGKEAKRVAFIQCAGSRDAAHLPYCSSYCCLTSLKQAAYVREKNPNAMAYVLYKDMRTPGQYELFYKSIQNDPGIMLTKGEVTGVSETQNGNLFIDLKDTLLGENIRIEADMVVLATGMEPNTKIDADVLKEWKVKFDEKLKESGGKPDPNAPLEPHKVPNVLKLEYRQGPELPGLEEAYGFADSNYICFQYETRRTGIFAAGSVRQPMHMLGSMEDALGASMKAIQCVEATEKGYSIHPRAWDQTYPEVNLQKCTSCKRCTEECPFGAIEEDAKGTPFHKMTRCRRCGTCLGSCPERVINFKDFSINMISSMFKSMDVPEEGLRLIGLACENDAYPALDALAMNRDRVNPAFRFVPVRCLGNLNLAWIADALSRGIDGMILLGCKFGENYQCHFVRGSELASERLGKLQETLGRLMLEPERVKLVQLSIQDYDKLPEILNDFSEEVGEMEPNPFKEF
ncbi:MAG: FAD-dependent oxidoreductase [Nitrospiraceae bacterium]|nr:MAG: FAD-dependent oxidoreductase [Nitrospiraceae bacterium]